MFGTDSIFDAAEAAVKGQAEEKETAPSDPSPEKAETATGQQGETEQTPEDLKNGKEPLHRDERFRRVVGDKNRYRRELEEARAELQKYKSAPQPQQSQQQSQQAQRRPSWFTDFFGEGPKADEAWDGFKQMSSADREQAKREALDEFRRESQSASEEAKRWEGWVGEQLDALEEEGEDFDRNALQKFLSENPVVDAQGNLDFRKGLSLMRKLNPKADNTEDKRKAGSLATEKAKGAPQDTKNKGVSPKDLQRLRNLGRL